MKLFYSLLITVGVGYIAGFATASSIDSWYAALNKPWFNPPNWLFAPVWTILYILMGFALSMIWRQPDSPQKKTAMRLFFVQLTLNFVWSFFFFYFHLIEVALIDILLLWVSIIATMIFFYPLKKRACWLLLPYLVWVSFASLLNWSIWQLNQG